MPRSTCFQDFINCNRDCAALPSALDRFACGLDCELDLVICVKNSLGLMSATEALELSRTMRTGLPLRTELALFPDEIEEKKPKKS